MNRRLWLWSLAIVAVTTTLAVAEGGHPGHPQPKRRTETGTHQNSLDQRSAELTEQISAEMTENRKRTIAVVEFVDLKGNVTDLGRLLSEELITRLFQTKRFTVIERQMLNKVIAEQKLPLTGSFDQSSARQLGRLLGVDAICSGTIADLGQSLKINARLISAQTGTVFAVAATEMTKDASVTNLMAGGTISSSSASKPGDSPSVKPPASQKVQAQFFTFELKQCRISGASVICDLLITNKDRDRELELQGGRLFDDFGNNYRTTGLQLANNPYGGRELLVAGVPTGARLKLDEVSSQATRITLLRVGFWVPYTGDFVIEFRNLPLAR